LLLSAEYALYTFGRRFSLPCIWPFDYGQGIGKSIAFVLFQKSGGGLG
jgi:hypothetical protein